MRQTTLDTVWNFLHLPGKGANGEEKLRRKIEPGPLKRHEIIMIMVEVFQDFPSISEDYQVVAGGDGPSC